MNLYAELKRRNVFRVAAAYLVLGWLFLQIASVVLSFVGAPDWVGKAIIALLVIGFAPTLAVAWVFEVGPERIQRDDGKTSESNGRHARRLDILTLIGVVVVVLMVFAEQLRVPEKEEKPESATAPLFTGPEKGANAASVAVAVQAVPRKSIAVLPFADLSPTHDQEYFSDGIAEEILNALVRVKDLKVAGRTSSFYFKGKNENLKTIGDALGVAHILEGSVRKQGEKVRITAQLIQTEDGFHLWSETYDGDLSDVFELQERIARAITDKLEVILQGDQEQRLISVATKNPEAYALYLQATAIFNRREGPRMGDAIAQLEEALVLDPKFARAHSRLAALHAIAPGYARRDFTASLDAAERHAHRAIEIDGALAEPYAVLGTVYGQQGRYQQERKAFERALALDPDDVTANFWFATSLITTGYRKKGNEVLDRVLAIDPILPIALYWRGTGYAYAGDVQSAERFLRRAADFGLAHVGFGLALVAEAHGRKEEAIGHLAAATRLSMADFPAGASDVLARGVFGDAQARAKAVTMLDHYLATKPSGGPGIVPYGLLRLGEPARALALAQESPMGRDALFFGILWSPKGRAARTLPEFPEFARRAGLTQLWDEYGAPDLCRKNDTGNYVCE